MPALKQTASDLALFGGVPAFKDPLHVGRPNLGDRARFLEHVNGILDRRWLTNDGPLVQEFERRVAAFLGVKHCVAMCNATVALEIATRAAGFRGEVIVPSYTFVATAHALQWQEITPVFCDIDPRTHTLDPACIERHLTPRTTGILAVHLWGRPCDTAAIEAIAQRHGLRVIYDAAHAFACAHGGRMIGGFGACEVFSFHATKFLNCFEGGAITTNDDALAAKLRLMRNFGFSGYDNVIYVGTNGKMPEINAAMGLTLLDSVDDLTAANRRNLDAYAAHLAGLAGLTVRRPGTEDRNNFQYVVVEVDAADAALDRDELLAVLHAENILARRYFWPGAHRMEPYKSYFPNAGLLLPETERVAARVLVLPTGQSVSLENIALICAIIRSALAAPAAVKAALAARP